MSGHGELAVYLVRDHRDVVALADVARAFQLFGCPYPSGRVVGIAKQQYPCARVGGFLLQVVIVHAVRIAFEHQGVGYAQAAVVADGRVEAVVHRPLHQHPVARAGQCLEDGGYGGYHARGVDDVFRADVPSVAAGKPVADGRVVCVGHVGVAEDAVLHPSAQGVDDGLCGAEVHVCHPHGQYPVIGHAVPLLTIGPPAGDDGVKIVCHSLFLLWLRMCLEGLCFISSWAGCP